MKKLTREEVAAKWLGLAPQSTYVADARAREYYGGLDTRQKRVVALMLRELDAAKLRGRKR